MRNSWSDLFLLGLVQCRAELCLPALLSALAAQLQQWIEEDRLPLARAGQLTRHLARYARCNVVQCSAVWCCAVQ